MSGLVEAVAVVIPGVVRLGRVHVPVYGVFAAVGLMAALWLSQKAAVKVGLAAEKVWDAGVFAVLAAFVASRVLLVLGDVRSFVRYPLLVLALPSLTYAGMAVTVALVWGYLRWKRLPVLSVMDAWAPCAAVLAAVLQVGHFVEGTDAGMPTRLPWGVRTPGDSVLGKVHPVQLYAAVLAIALAVWMYARLRESRRSGETAGWGMMLGGVVSFLLDMLRQPVESGGSAWLEAGQWVALMVAAAGVVILLVGDGARGGVTRVVAMETSPGWEARVGEMEER